jgi:4-amino-4-deoxy-L-arabinose transferase-like glycosyltransferase
MVSVTDEQPAAPGLVAPRPIAPQSRRAWVVVAAICAIAFGLRVAEVIVTRHSYRPVNDSAAFDSIANSIVHGRGFGRALVPPATGPTAYRGPLYPIVLAGWYAVFGHSWTAGRVQQALIGTALVAMTGVVASLLFTRRVGLVAMALASVYPTLILYGSSLQLEPLLVTLSLGSLAAALEHRRRPRGAVWPVVAGLLLGLALLTREVGIVLVIPVLWLVWRSPGARPRSRAALMAPAAVAVAAILVLVPWTIRNELRLHTFAPTSTSTGFTLSGTYNATSAADPTYPTVWRPPYQDPALTRLLLSRPHPSEAWVNHVLEKATFDYIRAHPLYPFRAALWNAVGLLDLDGTRIARFIAPYVPYPIRLVELSVYSSWMVDVLALIGIMLPLSRRAPRVVWLIPALAFVLIIFVSGNIRYRASIEPYFVLLAAVTLTAAWEGLAGRTRRGPDRALPAPEAA